MPTASVKVTTDTTASASAPLVVVALVLFLVAPRAAPFTLALIAIALTMMADRRPAWRELMDAPRPIWLLLGLGAWAAFSTIWAADRIEAIHKSALLVLFTLGVWWVQATLGHARPELLRHAGRAALVTLTACIAYLCFEEVSGHLLKRVTFTLLPFTRPAAKHLGDDGELLAVSGYISNRNMAAVVLSLWPMLLMLPAILQPQRRMQAVAALVVMVLATAVFSKHETSVIALVLSGIVFAVASRWPRIGLTMVAGGWIVATLLIVPIATWASTSAQLHSAGWLPNSARHRIVLWAYTAEQVWQRPLHGVGASSTKLIDSRRGPSVDPLPGTKYQWRSGTHAHNVYLQTWYELGAIGALLLCTTGLSLVAAMARLPRSIVPHAAAAVVAAAVVGAFTWGLWQAWFMAAFAVSASLCAAAIHLRELPGSGGNSAV